MKIDAIHIKNFKRIKEITIAAKGKNVLVIAGKNGQGKTSVLDSIWATLSWRNASHTIPRPIREGEDHAEVTIKLNGMTVSREWEKEGRKSKLVVMGEGYTTSQALLDGFIGQLSFDPLEFSRLTPKEQTDTLVGALDINYDVVKADKERATIFEMRTLKGRERDKAKGLLDSLEKPEGSKPKEIDAVKVGNELQAAQTHNSGIERSEERMHSINLEIQEYEEKIKLVKMEFEKHKKYVADNPKIDTAEISKKFEKAQEVQTIRNGIERYVAADKDFNNLANEYQTYTDQIDALDRKKRDAVAAADLPIKGLSVTWEGIYYNDIPFIQLSDSEKLKVSLAIAMKLNPDLKVIRITDGSLLDEDNMAVIERMAEKFGYQVWIEKVGETEKTEFIIREGELKDGKTKRTNKTK